MWFVITLTTAIYLCSPLPFDGYEKGPMTLDYPEHCEYVHTIRESFPFAALDRALKFMKMAPKEIRTTSWYKGSSFSFRIEVMELDTDKGE